MVVALMGDGANARSSPPHHHVRWLAAPVWNKPTASGPSVRRRWSALPRGGRHAAILQHERKVCKMLEIFLLILSIVWAIYVCRLISFGVRSAKQLVASTELTNLNLCLIYHALTPEAKACSEAIMARVAPKFVEQVRRIG